MTRYGSNDGGSSSSGGNNYYTPAPPGTGLYTPAPPGTGLYTPAPPGTGIYTPAPPSMVGGGSSPQSGGVSGGAGNASKPSTPPASNSSGSNQNRNVINPQLRSQLMSLAEQRDRQYLSSSLGVAPSAITPGMLAQTGQQSNRAITERGLSAIEKGDTKRGLVLVAYGSQGGSFDKYAENTVLGAVKPVPVSSATPNKPIPAPGQLFTPLPKKEPIMSVAPQQGFTLKRYESAPAQMSSPAPPVRMEPYQQVGMGIISGIEANPSYKFAKENQYLLPFFGPAGIALGAPGYIGDYVKTLTYTGAAAVTVPRKGAEFIQNPKGEGQSFKEAFIQSAPITLSDPMTYVTAGLIANAQLAPQITKQEIVADTVGKSSIYMEKMGGSSLSIESGVIKTTSESGGFTPFYKQKVETVPYQTRTVLSLSEPLTAGQDSSFTSSRYQGFTETRLYKPGPGMQVEFGAEPKVFTETTAPVKGFQISGPIKNTFPFKTQSFTTYSESAASPGGYELKSGMIQYESSFQSNAPARLGKLEYQPMVKGPSYGLHLPQQESGVFTSGSVFRGGKISGEFESFNVAPGAVPISTSPQLPVYSGMRFISPKTPFYQGGKGQATVQFQAVETAPPTVSPVKMAPLETATKTTPVFYPGVSVQMQASQTRTQQMSMLPQTSTKTQAGMGTAGISKALFTPYWSQPVKQAPPGQDWGMSIMPKPDIKPITYPQIGEVSRISSPPSPALEGVLKVSYPTNYTPPPLFNFGGGSGGGFGGSSRGFKGSAKGSLKDVFGISSLSKSLNRAARGKKR